MNATRPLWCACLVALASSCAHVHPQAKPDVGPPVVDSVTIGLWHMDDQAGIRVADAGPHHLDGIAGRSLQHPFGRYGSAAGLDLFIDSFVLVQYNPELESPTHLTVEAWIFPTAYGNYEDTPIAARWTEEANKQSWIFSLSGRRVASDLPGQTPRYHVSLFPDVVAGKLLFAYQPEAASPPRAYYSTSQIDLGRWTHVAVVFDGALVRFYIDGELDSQFASPGQIRDSVAPVLIGNYFDLRSLTSFGGDLRPDLVDTTPYYAFQGKIDELRLSRAARSDFPTRAPR